jgi:hypothetical protein
VYEVLTLASVAMPGWSTPMHNPNMSAHLTRACAILSAVPGVLGIVGWLLLGGPALAQTADWESTAIAEPVARVFVVADGTLVVQTAANHLSRTTTGGAEIEPITLPALPNTGTPGVLAIDPTDAHIVYVVTTAGLVKSADGGATYATILPGAIAGISISPVDPALVYVAAPDAGPSRLRFMRSQDAGRTFAVLADLDSQNPGCVFGLSLLQADQFDATRVFRSAACLAGRDLANPSFSQPLERSLDAGQTFASATRVGGFPERLVGGAPAAAMQSRYYLADSKPLLAAPAAMYRSDDGAASFSQVFQFPATPGSQTAVGDLAYDPTAPDRVFVGRRNGMGGVVVSEDGGLSFVDLGRQDIGEVVDLALDASNQTLYAGTGQGLFRLALQQPPTAPPAIPAGARVFFSRDPESLDDFDAVFAVERDLSGSSSLEAAVAALIAGPTSAERAAGYFSDWQAILVGTRSTCKGQDFVLMVHSGMATVQLCRQTSSAGIGQDARAQAEIESTLKQFPGVTRVVVLNTDGHCLFDASGLDRCLEP